jgi:hypothetical protein
MDAFNVIERNIMRSILACLLMVYALAIPAFAQTPVSQLSDAANRELAKLVRNAANAEQQTIPGGQRQMWAARHPVLTGTLIGLGIGIPIGASTCKYPGADGSSCAYFTDPARARLAGGVTIGLVGAGIGASIGALIGALER